MKRVLENKFVVNYFYLEYYIDVYFLRLIMDWDGIRKKLELSKIVLTNYLSSFFYNLF